MRLLFQSLLLRIEFECDREHISGSKQLSGTSMNTVSIDPEPVGTWCRMRTGLEKARAWPASGNSLYSPLLCLSLLLAIGLIVEFGF
jgi:hypothetical protein